MQPFDWSILQSLFSKVLAIFVTLDPIGNVGLIAALVTHYTPEHQKRILHREALIALLIMFVFLLVGAEFLALLNVSNAAIHMTGGVVFLFLAMQLLFPSHAETKADKAREPFIVPIAIPLVAGPSCLATIMLFSATAEVKWEAPVAIVIAWAPTYFIMIAAPAIAKKMGPIGIQVFERVVGLLCTLLAFQMIMNGVRSFLQHWNSI
jgi:multiple antibiotic resistance protein